MNNFMDLEELQKVRNKLRELNKLSENREKGRLVDVTNQEYALKDGDNWERTYTLYDLIPKEMIP
jgi:bisphosphoglycerate-independent phosphoglycerate mutase (AlkP superfamily)